MKEIRDELVRLLKEGHCTPRIVELSRELKESSPTIHYNIKQLEKAGIIIRYKAVFNYKKIDQGYCNYVLINLSNDEYSNPERIARELAKFPEVESVDIITGGWEIIIKVRTKDVDEFYGFVKNVLSKRGISRTISLTSLKQIKTEFIELYDDTNIVSDSSHSNK
ncbi:MAG: putative HTH-type transcriptional regulator [Candidatus Micrarchaeota archaeon]|nr:MAG: putative HTH-type transcriptional regulator [Candidatus Micrarchaeota archaeon]